MKKTVCALLVLVLLCFAGGVFAEGTRVQAGLYCPVEEQGASAEDAQLLTEMIRRCSADAVPLDTPENVETAAAALHDVDCLVFVCGDSDAGTVTDGTLGGPGENALIRAALGYGMPVLAIGRGMLVLNEALGGRTETDEGEAADCDNIIVFVPESCIGRALGGMGTYPVNIRHCTRVGTLAGLLTPTAIAEDGTVAAYEQAPDCGQMLIGLRFRPERFVLEGREQYLAFFRCVIERAEFERSTSGGHSHDHDHEEEHGDDCADVHDHWEEHGDRQE